MLDSMRTTHACELQRLRTEKAAEEAHIAKAKYYAFLLEEKKKAAEEEAQIRHDKAWEARAQAELSELLLRAKKINK